MKIIEGFLKAYKEVEKKEAARISKLYKKKKAMLKPIYGKEIIIRFTSDNGFKKGYLNCKSIVNRRGKLSPGRWKDKVLFKGVKSGKSYAIPIPIESIKKIELA